MVSRCSMGIDDLRGLTDFMGRKKNQVKNVECRQHCLACCQYTLPSTSWNPKKGKRRRFFTRIIDGLKDEAKTEEIIFRPRKKNVCERGLMVQGKNLIFSKMKS